MTYIVDFLLQTINTRISSNIKDHDYNTKNKSHGPQLVTPRGKVLFYTISEMNLDVKSRRTVNSRLTMPREYLHVSASLDLSSDHSPTTVAISNHHSFLTPTINVRTSICKTWFKFKKYALYCKGSAKKTKGYRFFYICFKKLLNIFSNFSFYLKVQSFRLIMENNFIQMAASAGHTVAYTIGPIFSTLSIVCSCVSPMALRILSFKASIVSGLSA